MSDADGAGGETGTPIDGATIEQVDEVVKATRQALNSAFFGDYVPRMPNDPTANESETYTATCTGGGTVRADYETFNVEVIDVVHIWLTFSNCTEFGITINGELYAETAGGANVENDLVVTGTPTYSTVGACTWDAKGTVVDWLGGELTSGTVCGVSATELASYPTTL